MVTNSGIAQDVDNSLVAADQLRSIIERIERLEEEKAGIAGDIKDVYAEAKANGFDTKTIRKIISLRKKDHDERMEEEAVLDLYMGALGMLSDTPLGQSAISREVAASEVTITYGDTKVTTTGAMLAEATARVQLDRHATAGRGSLKRQIGDSLKGAFGEENVVFGATIPRSGAGTMRAAAKRMRGGGQTDIEDAIAARG